MSLTLAEAREILKKFWGFEDFRPSQRPIVEAILAGSDVLALLPTGGGKSLCYQVPGLAFGGTTLVVSPLIALMKDQTEALIRRGISAVALHAGLDSRRLAFELERVAAGSYSFVYVAPERLLSESFREAITASEVKLVAVDEAHCISQWGYDFRPVYLQIVRVRDWWPKIQIAAFTATATEAVRRDICERLALRKPQILISSFQRSNLVYAVLPTEDKKSKILELLRYTRRSAIVYTRSRRRTLELSDFLNRQGIPSTFYHAGLPGVIRDANQNAWLSGQARVIVATNAFGMGIDKPDVQAVIHADVPDSPEAYFQEAGRAGRDGRKAYAFLLFAPSDSRELEMAFQTSFPSQEVIRKVYEALGIMLGLTAGEGAERVFPVDPSRLAELSGQPQAVVLSSLKLLEKEGYLVYQDDSYMPAQVIFRQPYRDVYAFMVRKPEFQSVIEAILRSYPGIFEEFKTFRFAEVARRSGLSMQEVEKKISQLHNLGLLEYIPATDAPRLTLLVGYQTPNAITFTREVYGFLKNSARNRLEAMLAYLRNNHKCRARQLLAYLGETEVSDCGDCDVCRKASQLFFTSEELNSAASRLIGTIPPGVPHKPEVILAALRFAVNKRNLELLRSLAGTGFLKLLPDGRIMVPR
jgi:ATP-dependent DNA helicase RecQ